MRLSWYEINRPTPKVTVSSIWGPSNSLNLRLKRQTQTEGPMYKGPEK